MPDPIRKTSPSHWFALAWPMPCGGQEEVRESGCLLFAGAEVGQNPGSKDTKALAPNSTPAPLPRIFPFLTQFLQMTRAALPHHHPTTTPSETPRSAAHRVQAMLPLPRLSRLGKHPAPRWEWDPPPRGARSSPTTSAISSTYFRLAARSKHGFPGAPPTSGNHLPK